MFSVNRSTSRLLFRRFWSSGKVRFADKNKSAYGDKKQSVMKAKSGRSIFLYALVSGLLLCGLFARHPESPLHRAAGHDGSARECRSRRDRCDPPSDNRMHPQQADTRTEMYPGDDRVAGRRKSFKGVSESPSGYELNFSDAELSDLAKVIFRDTSTHLMCSTRACRDASPFRPAAR